MHAIVPYLFGFRGFELQFLHLPSKCFMDWAFLPVSGIYYLFKKKQIEDMINCREYRNCTDPSHHNHMHHRYYLLWHVFQPAFPLSPPPRLLKRFHLFSLLQVLQWFPPHRVKAKVPVILQRSMMLSIPVVTVFTQVSPEPSCFGLSRTCWSLAGSPHHLHP